MNLAVSSSRVRAQLELFESKNNNKDHNKRAQWIEGAGDSLPQSRGTRVGSRTISILRMLSEAGLNDPALKHIAHENPPGLRVNVDVATSQQSSSILEKTKSTENPKDNESSHPVLKVNMLTCETIPVEMQPEDIGSRQAPQPTTSSNTRLSIEKKIKEVSSEVYIFEHIGAQPHDTDTSHSQQITQEVIKDVQDEKENSLLRHPIRLRDRFNEPSNSLPNDFPLVSDENRLTSTTIGTIKVRDKGSLKRAKKICIVDGKWAGNDCVFKRWNGVNALFVLNDGREVFLSNDRKIIIIS